MYTPDQNQEWRIAESEYTPSPRNGPSLRRSTSANQSLWEQNYNQQQQPPQVPQRGIQHYDNVNYRHLSYAEINSGYHQHPQQQQPQQQQQQQQQQQFIPDWSDTDRTLPRVKRSNLSSGSFSSYNDGADRHHYVDQHRKFPSSQSLTADQHNKKNNNKSRGLSRVRSFLGFNSSPASGDDLPSYEQSSSKRKSSTGLSHRRKHSSAENTIPQQVAPPTRQNASPPPPNCNWSPRLDTCYESQVQAQRTNRQANATKDVRPTSFTRRQVTLPQPPPPSNSPGLAQVASPHSPYFRANNVNSVSQPSTPRSAQRVPPAYPGRSASFNEHDLNIARAGFQVYQNHKISQ